MNKEIICINVGQAGVQVSNAAWELFCIEHGINVDGFPRNSMDPSQELDDGGINTFFHQTTVGRYVPRAISIDLEPTVIDEIRTGAYRSMWHPDCLISGFEDAANNFARGHNTGAPKMMAAFFRQLLRLVRDSQRRLHGFIINQSMGGGTGSGLCTALLDKIDTEFAKQTKLSTAVYPGPCLSTAVVEPYNAVLCTTGSVDFTDIVMLNDNESLYDICINKLHIIYPTYANLNRIVSQLFSSLTVSFRFRSSSLDHDLGHLQTNLVPYPRIHFPFANYAPLNNQNTSEHNISTTSALTNQLFDPTNQMLQCNLEVGKYMACCVQYRGLIMPRDISLALAEIKNRKDVNFVDWSPTGFKVGISPMPPGYVANSALAPTIRNAAMFTNSTSIEQAWERLLKKFDLLYFKRAFLHWYVCEGMEEAEFKDSKDELMRIKEDYKSLADDGPSENESVKKIKNSNQSFSNCNEMLPQPHVNENSKMYSNSHIMYNYHSAPYYFPQNFLDLRSNLDLTPSQVLV